jgi:hypothetical protein
MSLINKMLQDLDKRGCHARAPGVARSARSSLSRFGRNPRNRALLASGAAVVAAALLAGGYWVYASNSPGNSHRHEGAEARPRPHSSPPAKPAPVPLWKKRRRKRQWHLRLRWWPRLRRSRPLQAHHPRLKGPPLPRPRRRSPQPPRQQAADTVPLKPSQTEKAAANCGLPLSCPMPAAKEEAGERPRLPNWTPRPRRPHKPNGEHAALRSEGANPVPPPSSNGAGETGVDRAGFARAQLWETEQRQTYPSSARGVPRHPRERAAVDYPHRARLYEPGANRPSLATFVMCLSTDSRHYAAGKRK